MAQVRDVKLWMGRFNDQQNFADVNFGLEFSPAEIRSGLNYHLFVALLSGNDRYDAFRFDNPSGFPTGFENLNFNAAAQPQHNDFLRWVTREMIHPRGVSSMYLNRKCTFGFNSRNFDRNNFRAFVWLVPEVCESRGKSNVVRFDPQQMHYRAMMLEQQAQSAGSYVGGSFNGSYNNGSVYNNPQPAPQPAYAGYPNAGYPNGNYGNDYSNGNYNSPAPEQYSNYSN